MGCLFPIQDSSNLNYPIVVDKKTTPDTLSLIFNKLQPKDQLSASQVNRMWNKTALAFDKKEFGQLVQFIDFITSALNQDNQATQILKFEMLMSECHVLDSVNFQKIKKNVSELQEKILNLLKDFKEEELKYLEDLYKKKKFKPYCHFFDLSRFRIFDELINQGELDKAFEFLDTLPNQDYKKETFLESTFEKLVNQGDIEKAKKVAELFLEKENKYRVSKEHLIYNLSNILLNNMQILAALDMAQTFGDLNMVKKIYEKFVSE